MGGNISKDPLKNNNQHYGVGGYPPSPNQFQPGFTQQGAYTPPHPHSPSPYGYPSAPSPHLGRLQRKYSKIPDNYRTLDEVTAALAQAELESSNLIVGIDFTKSNEWTDKSNPYEQAISIIGKTLSKFDEDNLIPCYGFGDASTHDQDVFSFCDDNRYCQGFEEVLSRYREIAPKIQLSGPTSFAPIIEMAMTIVEQSGGQYHVLLIIADGQVTRSVDTIPGHLSPQEQNSLEAIVQASGYPLSIVLVGVGDGPWDMMKEFDDNVPSSAFDNFQFVNFTEIMSKKADISRKQTEFALSALMEIPFQYKATLEHGLLGRQTGHCQVKVPLPPPHCNKFASLSRSRSYSQSSSFLHSTSTRDKGSDSRTSSFLHSTSTRDKGSGSSSATPTTSMSIPAYDSQFCPVCIFNPRDMVFGCGHQACSDCGGFLDACPICLRPIEVRIRLC